MRHRIRWWLLVLASATVLRLGMECLPEPDWTDPVGSLLVNYGLIPQNPL